MFKKKTFFVVVGVLAFSIVGVSLFLINGHTEAESKAEEQEPKEKKKDTQLQEDENINDPHYNKYRDKLEELTNDEVIKLLKKSEDNNHQITEDFTEDDAKILRTITSKEYYDLMPMTKDEVLNWIDVYHGHINTNIILAHQDGGVDSEKYNEEHRDTILGLKSEFEWIRDNYEFEKEYHNDLIKEIVELIDAHVDGDNDALFSLKYILYELNQEYNPESFDEDRANHLTLSNAVRIQNGQDPIKEFE